MATRAGKPIVFVVDEDESVRDGLGRLIRSDGFEAGLFGSAERFLVRVMPLPPACVMLDVTMPRVNGIPVQRLLHGRRIVMPIIVISARDDGAARGHVVWGEVLFYGSRSMGEC